MEFIASSSGSNSGEVESGLKTQPFMVSCTNGKVAVGHAIFLTNSVYIWISDAEDPTPGRMDNLVISMSVKYESMPLASTLIGTDEDEGSQAIAVRLSKKYKIQVFLSSQLGINFSDKFLEIEAALSNLIKANLPN